MYFLKKHKPMLLVFVRLPIYTGLIGLVQVICNVYVMMIEIQTVEGG